MAKYEILLLGDGSHLFRSIAWVLEYKGYAVKAAASPEAAIEALVRKNYDLVITRLTAAEAEGLDVLKRAKMLNSGVKVMLISGAHEVTFPMEAYQLDVDDYILMPVTPAELWRRVSACLESVDVVDVKPVSGFGVEPQPSKQLNERVLHRLMIMLHDIRGSMVSTDASLKLLVRGKHGEMDDEARSKLQEVSTRLGNLIQLTEEFMGKGFKRDPHDEARQEVLDLRRDVVEPVLAELSPEIRDKGVTLDNRLAAGSLKVRGSKVWLKSVFRNLVANGIRHGGPGCHMVIDWEKEGPNGRLNVYNTGNQVPEEYRSILFSHPARKNRQARGERRGLGMGLYLSRNVAHSQGGDLYYEPKANGSNFVLTLPRS